MLSGACLVTLSRVWRQLSQEGLFELLGVLTGRLGGLGPRSLVVVRDLPEALDLRANLSERLALGALKRKPALDTGTGRGVEGGLLRPRAARTLHSELGPE